MLELDDGCIISRKPANLKLRCVTIPYRFGNGTGQKIVLLSAPKRNGGPRGGDGREQQTRARLGPPTERINNAPWAKSFVKKPGEALDSPSPEGSVSSRAKPLLSQILLRGSPATPNRTMSLY